MLKRAVFAAALLGTITTSAYAQSDANQIAGDTSQSDLIFPLEGQVSIEQIGTDNIAEVTSDSGSSVLLIEQRGDEQSALVRLSGVNNQGDLTQRGADNTARILVSGTINTFSINQSASSGGELNGNQALLEQIGFGNTAFQTQIGRENQMSLRQTGDDNFADMLQDGQSNVMELEQNDSGNSAILRQFQTEASPIIVTQTGGMSIEITQTGE